MLLNMMSNLPKQLEKLGKNVSSEYLCLSYPLWGG